MAIIVAGLVFALAVPRVASYRGAFDAIGSFGSVWLLPLVTVAALNLASPSLSQVAALPGLRMSRAVQADWASSTVVNTVPFGSPLALGLTVAMYRSWGHDRPAIGRAIVLTGIWDTLFKLATPALALGWLATERPLDGGLFQAAGIGVLLFAVSGLLVAALIGHPAPALLLTRAASRLPFVPNDMATRVTGLRIETTRADTVRLLRHRWTYLTGATIAGHVNLAVLLLVCVRGVGIDATALSAAGVAASFTFGRLVTALPITPGGLGIMELGLLASLTVTGTAEADLLLAAVLVFRFCSYAVPIPIGIVVWLLWSAGDQRTADARRGEAPGESEASVRAWRTDEPPAQPPLL